MPERGNREIGEEGKGIAGAKLRELQNHLRSLEVKKSLLVDTS